MLSILLAYLGLILGGLVFCVHIIALFRARTYLYKFCYHDKHNDFGGVGVSIIKTIVSYSPKIMENLESVFLLSYPKFDLKICVQGESSNAIPYIQDLMQKYDHIDAKLYCAARNIGVNPKINNMLQCYDDIKYDYVWICDSSIKVNKNSLHELASHLTENVGLVHQLPYYGNISTSYTASLERVYFACHHARWYLFFNTLGAMCVNGMSSVFNKRFLDQYGGLEALSQYIAEDHFMAKTLADHGHKIVLSTEPCIQNQDHGSFKSFVNRMIRWQILRLTMLPTSVIEPIIECFLVGVLLSYSVYTIYGVPVLTTYISYLTIWFIFDQMLLRSIEKTQVPPLHKFLVGWLFREITTYYIFLTALFSRKIGWHRGTFDISFGGVSKFVSKDAERKD